VRSPTITSRARRLRAGLLRDGGMALRVLKTGLASGLAWLLADHLFADGLPVLAPLAALLTVQVTVYRSLTVGLQRAAAVVAGVLLALLAARVLGMNAWTVGLLTAGALALGLALRLGQQAIQVPVSALLVLGLSAQSNVYPRDRVLETLLGSAVAVVINLVVVPPLFTPFADLRLAALAESIATLLAEIARGLTEGWDRARAHGWLQQARMLHEPVDESRESLGQAEESLRYNPRRAGGMSDTDRQRTALMALEHASFQARGIARTLTDLARSDPGAAARLSPRFGELLAATAAAAQCYAEALRGEAGGLDRLRTALATARERMAEASVALQAGGETDTACWQLLGALLSDAGRLLREIDPDAGPHAWAPAEAAAPPPDRVTPR
jgi:uncharacterized membrane protein YgaE (UPF0421/DUF939 family)